MERMFEDDESTKKLMAEEIERLTKPPRMIRSQLRDHDLLRIQNEAGQGMLTIDVARWPSKPGGPATDVWQRGYRSRKAAFLKSPAILASKARLRARKAARMNTCAPILGSWKPILTAYRMAKRYSDRPTIGTR